ncbi:MAG: glycosyltransferase [Candidatus Coatesbacteria bacterium]|nr:glycosyltransferase [Candidatus Coatesbacteria bacterium]
MLSLFKKKEDINEINITQSGISIIIPVHNEEEIIEKKIEDTINVSNDITEREIIIVDDASNDNTSKICKNYSEQYPFIKLKTFDCRGGKTRSINYGTAISTHEFILYTDANIFLKGSDLLKTLSLFTDEKVGCICGEKRPIQMVISGTGKGVGFYARWEWFVKSLESKIDSVVGADGGLFMIRKRLFTALPEDVIDDFTTSLNIRIKGYKIILSTYLLGMEPATTNYKEEFISKVRVISRAWKGFLYSYRVLYFWKYPVFTWEFISHKILRWLSPFFMLCLLLIVPVSFNNIYFMPFSLLYIIFLILSFLGYLSEKNKRRNRFLSVPFYFCLVNFAAINGLARFLMGKSNVIWQKSQSSRKF